MITAQNLGDYYPSRGISGVGQINAVTGCLSRKEVDSRLIITVHGTQMNDYHHGPGVTSGRNFIQTLANVSVLLRTFLSWF